MATQPDITSPVSRTRAASLGTILNFGTAVNSNAGGLNATVGGSADNGVASFQNTAKNPVVFNIDTNNGGASLDSLVSSQNPVSIQLDSTNDKQSQYVARTAQALVSNMNGFHVDFPNSNVVANPQTHNPNYTLDGYTYPNSRGNAGGLQDSNVYGSQTNLGNLQNDVSVADTDPVRSQRNGGAKAIGSPTPQVRNESEEGITSTNFVKNGPSAEAPVANGLNAQFTDVQVG